MPELEAIALAGNPAIHQAEAELAALHGKYVQVGLPPNPEVGYMASEIGSERSAGQQGGYVSQELITGGKLRLNREVVAYEIERAEQNADMVRRRVVSDVQQGYYSLLIAQQRLDLAKSLLATSRRIADTVESQVRAKEASRIDYLQARVEVHNARILVDNAETTHAAAWQRLAAVLGQPDMPPVTAVGDPAKLDPPLQFESALRRIGSSSPELAAAWAEVQRAAAAAERARAEIVPNVLFQAIVQRDEITNDTITGVQVGLPLPIRNRNQGGIVQADSEWAAAHHATQRLELSLRRRLAAVFRQYAMSRQQALRYREAILPDVEETLSLTTQAFDAGEISFLQLLTVERSYFQANLAMLDALEQMWQADRQIENLLFSGSLEVD